MHSHHDHHDHCHAASQAERNLGLAFFLNLGFALIELFGGWWCGSLAILSDALHDFGDALSFGMGYMLQKKSRGKPTETYSYGLKRLSLLSAVLSGLIISIGAIGILYTSIPRIFQPTEPNGPIMLLLAVFGLLVNGFAAWKMSGGHTHNEKMLRWHLIEDVLGWAIILIGSGALILFKWNWLDPIMAIFVSAFVLFNVFRQLTKTVNLFLQANPNPEALKHFRRDVEKITGTESLHDVHFWSLDGVHHVLSMHVVTPRDRQADVKKKIYELSPVLGHCHLTIQFEEPNEVCADDCESKS